MGSLDSYDQGDMQTRRPVHIHEGPGPFSWPGAVSPFDVVYEERRRFEEQRNLQHGKQVERVAEVAEILEPVLVAG